MPVIQTFLDWVMEHMPEIQAVMSAVFGAIEWVVQTVVDVFNTYFLPTIQKIVGWVQEHWPTIQEVIAKVFDTIKQVWEETLKPVFEAVMGLLKTVWDLFKTAWPVIQRIVKVAFDLIKTYYNSILKPVFEFITKLINKLKEKFDEHMPKIEKVFKAMADTIEWAWEKIIKPAVEAIGDVLSWLFGAFEEYIWPLVSLVIDWFAEMTNGMSEKIEWVRDKIDLAIQKITGFFDGIKEMKDNVLGWFTDIKDGIAEKINNAKEAVGDAIDKIKGFFDFNFEWPKLKMPKFSIEGTMNPLKWLKEGVPKLKVNWNAAGAIFDRPTIFSTPYGLQGVGEAGPEAVAPIGKLQSYIAEAVAEARGNQGMNIVVNVDRMDSTTDIDELMEYMGNRMKEKAYSLGLV
jgi:phage-related protein